MTPDTTMPSDGGSDNAPLTGLDRLRMYAVDPETFPLCLEYVEAALDEIDALDADLNRSNWQPIETAPNGRHILFFPAEIGRNALPVMIAVDHYPVYYPRKPSHWMPIPAALSQPTVKEG